MTSKYIIDLWRSVYTSYNKDPIKLDEWVTWIEKHSLLESIDIARSLTKFQNIKPSALTLGFSPQALIGILSYCDNPIVITSPEVVKGSIKPAIFSHRIIELFKDKLTIIVTPLAPNSSTTVNDVINSVKKTIIDSGVRELDISGGTQLVAIAAYIAGIKTITYAYPNGSFLYYYSFNL